MKIFSLFPVSYWLEDNNLILTCMTRPTKLLFGSHATSHVHVGPIGPRDRSGPDRHSPPLSDRPSRTENVVSVRSGPGLSIPGRDDDSRQTRVRWNIPMSLWQQARLIAPLIPNTHQEMHRSCCHDSDDDGEHDRALLRRRGHA